MEKIINLKTTLKELIKPFTSTLGTDVQFMLLVSLFFLFLVLIIWFIISIFHFQNIERILHRKLKHDEYQDVINIALEFMEKKKKKRKRDIEMVLYYLASAYEKTKSFTNALKFYEEVFNLHHKKDKFYQNILINMAKIYEKQGRTKEALAHYLMALDADEYNIEALYKIGVLHYRNCNIKKSLDYFEKLLLKKPAILDARKFYAKALADAGFYQPAMNQFEFLVHYYPDDFEVFYFKAKTEENLKKYVEAIKSYKTLIKREFNEEKSLERISEIKLADILEEAKLNIVRLFIKLKKYDESINAITEYLSLPGKDETKLELLYLYGNVLWNKGEEFQALKNYERIYMMKPDFRDVSLFYERYKKILPHTYLSNYFTTIEEGTKNFDSLCRKILGKQNFNLVYKSTDYFIYSKGPFAVVFYRHIEPIAFSKLTDIEIILNSLPIPVTNVEIYSISGVREDAYTHFLLKKSHLIEANEFIKTIRNLF
ncbi:MAG: tetratricopeptide repeat protein [Brevinematia bacterium]